MRQRFFVLLVVVMFSVIDRVKSDPPNSNAPPDPKDNSATAPPRNSSDLFLARSLGGTRYSGDYRVFVAGGAAPELVRLPKGGLLAVFEIQQPGRFHPALYASRSNDDGHTWARARGILIEGDGPIYRGSEDKDRGGLNTARHADILRLPNGALRLYFTMSPDAGRCEIRSATSIDGLKYKLDPIAAAVIERCDDARPGIVRTSSGFHLFITVLSKPEAKTPSAEAAPKVLHYISRDGRKFKREGEVKLGGVPASGFTAHAKGRMRAIVNVEGNLRTATSRDGKEWKLEPEVLITDARNASVVEMRDGTFLMAFERSHVGNTTDKPAKSLVAIRQVRPGLPANMSMEGDAQWRAEREAEARDNPETESETADPEPDWPAFADEQAVTEATEPAFDPAQTDEMAQAVSESTEDNAANEPPAHAPEMELDEHAKAEQQRLAQERDEWLAVPDVERPQIETLPPLPDFTTPVNYAEWYARLCDINTPDNAYWAYDEFMPSPLNPDRQKEWPSLDVMYNRTDFTEPAPWDPAQLPEWEASYQASLPLMEKFEAASRHAGFARPVQFRPEDSIESPTGQPLLIGLLLPDLASHRALVKQTLGANWRIGDDGKPAPDKMMEGWRTSLASANHMHQGATLIEQLVGTAEQNLVQSDARHALQQGVFKGDQLELALSVLEQNDHDDFDAARSMQGEHAFVLDLMQAMFKSEKPGDPPRPNHAAIDKVMPEIFGQESKDLPKIKTMTPADVKKSLNAFETFYAEASNAMATGYPEVRSSDLDRMAKKHIDVSPLTHALLPAFGRIQKLRARNEASRRATQLSYAVHIYKEQNGRWPQSLAELPERVTPNMRTDPFTGGQFGYRVDANGPVIYSLSENGQDDGGQHSTRWDDEKNGESDDHVFWPPQAK